MGPALNLGYLLIHTTTVLMRQSDQVLQERLGIGMSQFKILIMLRNTPNVQQRKLAECLGQTEASVSRQIKLLYEKGLLSTRVNPKSRREHITIPTTKGLKITDAALDILENYNQPILDQFSLKQRQQFSEMLKVIHAHCCSPDKSCSCDSPFSED